jgi:hypothetical protein
MPKLAWLLVVLDALCVASAYVALALAPKAITAAEVSLIFLGELVIAPFWVYLRFGEVRRRRTRQPSRLLSRDLPITLPSGRLAPRSPPTHDRCPPLGRLEEGACSSAHSSCTNSSRYARRAARAICRAEVSKSLS